MNCPQCGHEKTKITRTIHKHIDGDACVIRERRCEQCTHKFPTFENYELADVEACFDVRDMQETIKTACDWLSITAAHIPIVRDARKKLLRFYPQQ